MEIIYAPCKNTLLYIRYLNSKVISFRPWISSVYESVITCKHLHGDACIKVTSLNSNVISIRPPRLYWFTKLKIGITSLHLVMVHNPAHDLFSIGYFLCRVRRHQSVQISKSFGLQPVTTLHLQSEITYF